jgi:hypothetical protein
VNHDGRWHQFKRLPHSRCCVCPHSPRLLCRIRWRNLIQRSSQRGNCALDGLDRWKGRLANDRSSRVVGVSLKAKLNRCLIDLRLAIDELSESCRLTDQ